MGELRVEGPFGVQPGYYFACRQLSVFHNLHHPSQKNPFFTATIVRWLLQWKIAFSQSYRTHLFCPATNQLPEIVDIQPAA